MACKINYEARRARAARRLRARRSSSLKPPQTPESWFVSKAYCRQYSVTGQCEQTALARSICSTAGPVFPIGKKSSGSTVRHAALSRQSMKSPSWGVSNVTRVKRASTTSQGDAFTYLADNQGCGRKNWRNSDSKLFQFPGSKTSESNLEKAFGNMALAG